MNFDDNKIPVGGASLECLLAYDRLEVRDFCRLLSDPSVLTLLPAADDAFLISIHDEFRVAPPTVTDASLFSAWLWEQELDEATARFSQPLFDQSTVTCIQFVKSLSVLQISTIEDVIWGFSNEPRQADIRRLAAFFDFCHAVCKLLPPRFAEIGSEPCHADEIAVSNQQGEFEEFSESKFFSPTHVQQLFDWYVTEYGTRWNRALKIDRSANSSD